MHFPEVGTDNVVIYYLNQYFIANVFFTVVTLSDVFAEWNILGNAQLFV